MSAYDCDRWRSRLELLLDDALPEHEAAAFGDHSESCAACRAYGRDALRLHAVLPSVVPRALRATPTPTARPLPPESQSSARFRFARAWRPALAAAAATILVLLGSRILLPPAGNADVEVVSPPVLAAGSYVAGVDGLRLSAGPSGFVDLAPETALDVTPDAEGLALRLVHGEVRLPTSTTPWRVETSAGRLEIAGAATLIAAAAPTGGPATVLRLHGGTARVASGGVERDLDPREPFVALHGGEVTPAAAWLLPDDDGFPGDDEGLVTSRDLRARENAFDTERNALLARVGQLMAEKNRLELEVETLRRNGRSRGGLSVHEIVRTIAERAENSPSSSPEWGGKLRAVKHSFEGHEDEALRAIDDLLLAATATPAQRKVGLRLLGSIRVPGAGDRLLAYVGHVDRELRDLAIDGLASFAEARFRPALEAAFRSDVDDGVRVAAAGGLVRLGDQGEPIAWLKRVYENRDTPKTLKRRVLSRLMFAPVAAQTSVFLDVLTARDADPGTQREIVDFLRHVGGRRGLELLETLTTAPLDPELLEYIRRAIERTPDHPFRPR